MIAVAEVDQHGSPWFSRCPQPVPGRPRLVDEQATAPLDIRINVPGPVRLPGYEFVIGVGVLSKLLHVVDESQPSIDDVHGELHWAHCGRLVQKTLVLPTDWREWPGCDTCLRLTVGRSSSALASGS